jgi:hypothetical protein
MRKASLSLARARARHILVLPKRGAARGNGTWVTTARAAAGGGGRRARGGERREHAVTVKLSATEKAVLEAAASRAGLALAAYLSQASLDAAEHRAVPVPVLQRELLLELIRAGGLVRRAGTRLSQAVARLNATGTVGPDLRPAAAYCTRVAAHVDQAALLIRRDMTR